MITTIIIYLLGKALNGKEAAKGPETIMIEILILTGTLTDIGLIHYLFTH